MKVTILLADSAQSVGGKLYVLGGGWSITGPAPTPMALAIKIEVPWDQANQHHRCVIELIDQDGEPVTVPDEQGEPQPVSFNADFEVGRPPGLKPGTPIDLNIAINLGPLPLAPGHRYAWQLSIDGHADEDWRVAFTMRPNP